MTTTQKKFAVYLPADKAEALERVSKEDKRTFTAIFEIGLDLYLGSRNNYRWDAEGSRRLLPGETQ
jgi:hypothetical protein